VIYVGMDDTDVEGARGTNQLARSLVAALAADFRCVRIVRHQLLEDPRVPCTTRNGSASIALEPLGGVTLTELAARCRDHMLLDFIEGSDPGLCVTASVPGAVTGFGFRSKSKLVTQEEARRLARRHGIFLEGLGGTCGGVIGALAAVGLAATGDDGRVVQLAQWPDDMCGVQPIESLRRRGVAVCRGAGRERIDDGLVDVGKRLRPNRRRGETVLFVEPAGAGSDHPWKAKKLP
jgi:hypothetical protein